jgi:hypothetical protein
VSVAVAAMETPEQGKTMFQVESSQAGAEMIKREAPRPAHRRRQSQRSDIGSHLARGRSQLHRQCSSSAGLQAMDNAMRKKSSKEQHATRLHVVIKRR